MSDLQVQPYVRSVSSADSDLWSRLKPKLNNLDIELTERCNNACIHCTINRPRNDVEAMQEELTTAEIQSILTQAADLGCLSVRFTGGEPTLRDDFAELYLFAKRLGMKVLIFTNATFLTEELVSLFDQYPPGKEIEVTVYGMRRESYEAVSRLKGSYDAAFAGIRLLQKYEVPFIVKGAFLPQNKEDIPAFEAFAKTIPWQSHAPSYSMFYDLRTRHDSASADERIRQLRPLAQEALKVLTREPQEYIKSMREFCARYTRPKGDRLFSCGAGLKKGAVDAYGQFQVCLLVRHPDTVYDLRKGTLADALDRFFPEVLKVQATNEEYRRTCGKCFLKGLCEQCPGKSWSEHGTIDTPVSYLCEVTHAQARYLGLLGADEYSWQVQDWQERLEKFSGKLEFNLDQHNVNSSERKEECR